MDIIKVEGKEGVDIFLYTLSTCGWCKKTKEWLKKKRLSYRFVDVDLAGPEDKKILLEEIHRWNQKGSFPTMVIDGQDAIVGFKPEKFKELFK